MVSQGPTVTGDDESCNEVHADDPTGPSQEHTVKPVASGRSKVCPLAVTSSLIRLIGETPKSIVQVQSHAKPIKKVKKEETSKNNLSNIPSHLRTRYLDDFQPGFIRVAITISKDPWQRLAEDDAGVLLETVFPELDHTIKFGDMFYAPVCVDRPRAKLL
jgi:hypothetical protein